MYYLFAKFPIPIPCLQNTELKLVASNVNQLLNQTPKNRTKKTYKDSGFQLFFKYMASLFYPVCPIFRRNCTITYSRKLAVQIMSNVALLLLWSRCHKSGASHGRQQQKKQRPYFSLSIFKSSNVGNIIFTYSGSLTKHFT